MRKRKQYIELERRFGKKNGRQGRCIGRFEKGKTGEDYRFTLKKSNEVCKREG